LLINIDWRNGIIVADNSNPQVDARNSEFLWLNFSCHDKFWATIGF
jgi:hypothetical protein